MLNKLKMAEAAVESRLVSRYYCHQCSAEITPNIPEYTCPRCNSGFIEEVAASDNSGTSSSDASPQVHTQIPAAQLAEVLLSQALNPMEMPGSSGARPGQGSSTPGEVRPGPSGHTTMRFVQAGGRNPYMEGLINFFLNRLGGDAMHGIPVNMLHLHGSPGDYAWGAGGLDSIITQLLNQLENSGPPPAERDKIDSLPTVTITQEQVDKVLQCSVCMEDFNVGESVRRLPCDHHYHNDCIVQWLELHGTCPVCRKDLNGQDTSTSDANFDASNVSSNQGPGYIPTSSSSNSSTETNPSLD